MRDERYTWQQQIFSKDKGIKKTTNFIILLLLCIIILLGAIATIKIGKGDNAALPYLKEYFDSKISNKNADIEARKNSSAHSDVLPKDSTNESNEDWKLLLVNKNHPVPEGFTVNLETLSNGHAIDERVYPDLQRMMNDARAAGLFPYICASYRTQEDQIKLFDTDVRKYKAEGYSEEEAKVKAASWVAVPGTSEHQLGLALDIVASKYPVLDKQQEQTPEQIWLMKNSYKYGFILRYPSSKSEITGIGYEPWHYRYVGKEAAEEITKKGICLEEYLGMDK